MSIGVIELASTVRFEFDGQAIVNGSCSQISGELILTFAILAALVSTDKCWKNGEQKVEASKADRGECHDITSEGEAFSLIVALTCNLGSCDLTSYDGCQTVANTVSSIVDTGGLVSEEG